MADELTPPIGTGNGDEPVSPPAPPTPEPQPQAPDTRDEELAYYRSLDAQLASKRDVIDAILRDEDAYAVTRESLKARDAYRQAQDDRPRWAKELADDVKAVKGDVEKRTKEAEIIGAKAYVEGLAATYPHLRENNWKAVSELEQTANSLGIKSPTDVARFVGEVVKRTSTPAQKRTELPDSLRADDGQPGIPGRREVKPSNPQDIRPTLIARAKEAAG